MPLKRRKRLKRKDGKEEEGEEKEGNEKEKTLTTENEAMNGESLALSEAEIVLQKH